MSMHVSRRSRNLSILLAAAAAAAFADTIDFETQCPTGQTANGPCSGLYSTVGNAQTLSIPTSIGSVMVEGGALFDDISNLPSDETAVYGSAGNATNIGVSEGSDFTNPITLVFPEALTNFSLDVLNGNTLNVTYVLADNLGNTQSFLIAPNLSGGVSSVGFAAAGNVITIEASTGQSTPSGATWDFLIDNINFTAQQSAVPEPASASFIAVGLLCLGLSCIPRGWFRKSSHLN